MLRRLFLLLTLLACALPAHAAKSARPLYIAAASDLAHCVPDLNAAFQAAHPQAELKLTLGASGNFHAQIANGAPFDVFLSADIDYPRRLADAGHADAASLTPYAVGALALWTADPRLDVGQGFAVLGQAGAGRVAIANPDHAPYGRAARAALQHAQWWDRIQPRLIVGENVAQAAQFAQTGNAGLALIALSLVRSPAMAQRGRHYAVPASFHPPLEQAAIVTARGARHPLAAAYVAFLRTPQARAVFARHGFAVPAR